MDMNYRGGMWEGEGGQDGVKGGKWENCNSIINKYILKKNKDVLLRNHNIVITFEKFSMVLLCNIQSIFKFPQLSPKSPL